MRYNGARGTRGTTGTRVTRCARGTTGTRDTGGTSGKGCTCGIRNSTRGTSIGVGTHRAGGALAPPFEIVEGLSQSFFGNYN